MVERVNNSDEKGSEVGRGKEAIEILTSFLSPSNRKVSPNTFDERMQLERHELEKEKIEKLIDAWSKQQKADKKLRKLFGKWLLGALLIQLAVASFVFILDSMGTIIVDPAKLPIWLGSIVIEVIGLVAIIARGLFANMMPSFMKMMSSVLGNHFDEK